MLNVALLTTHNLFACVLVCVCVRVCACVCVCDLKNIFQTESIKNRINNITYKNICTVFVWAQWKLV